MYIRNLKMDTIVETECPLVSITPTLRKELYDRVDKAGYVSVSTTRLLTNNNKATIVFTVLLLSVIPPFFAMFICLWTSAILPDDFVFANPAHVAMIVVLLTVIFSCIPFVWLFYNNRLSNCIYLNILTKITRSFCENVEYTANREEAFMYYLKLSSKEWNYYDHIDKL